MRRPSNELVRDAIQTLTAHGFAFSIINGRHKKIKWTDDDGRHHALIVSRSPSDWRGQMNSRATLRRLLRNGK